jgi:hypothetical protein
MILAQLWEKGLENVLMSRKSVINLNSVGEIYKGKYVCPS